MTKRPDSILNDPGIKELLLIICRALGQFTAWVTRYYREQKT